MRTEGCLAGSDEGTYCLVMMLQDILYQAHVP